MRKFWALLLAPIALAGLPFIGGTPAHADVEVDPSGPVEVAELGDVPPSTDLSIAITSPADGAVYVKGEAVMASYSCAAADGSPLVSCTGPVANGDPLDTTTPGPQSFTVTAEDNAGTITEVTHGYTVVPDDIAPSITITRPSRGAVYWQGQPVTARYSCADTGGSGLASCTGPVPSGSRLGTRTVGIKSFTVTAEDQAGNTRAVERSYRVVRFRPDMLIRRRDQRSFVGNNTYNTTGTNQTVRAAIRRGTGITAYLRVQNDGTYRDRFILRGTASNPNADIRYFRGQTNISSAVKSGNYRSPYLSPGSAHTIRLVVDTRPTASPGAEIRVNLTARSAGQSTKRDRVSAIVEVLRPPPPPPTQHCDPNYSPCVPIASDVDCAGGSGNGPAYVEGPVRVIGNDIYDLDSDGDGIGCE